MLSYHEKKRAILKKIEEELTVELVDKKTAEQLLAELMDLEKILTIVIKGEEKKI